MKEIKDYIVHLKLEDETLKTYNSNLNGRTIVLPISFERPTTKKERTNSHFGDKFIETLRILGKHLPKKVDIKLSGGLQVENEKTIFQLEYGQPAPEKFISKMEAKWKDQENLWYKKEGKHIKQQLEDFGIEVSVQSWGGEYLSELPSSTTQITRSSSDALSFMQKSYDQDSKLKFAVDSIADKVGHEILKEIHPNGGNEELLKISKDGVKRFVLIEAERILSWTNSNYDAMLYPGVDRFKLLTSAIFAHTEKKMLLIDIEHKKKNDQKSNSSPVKTDLFFKPSKAIEIKKKRYSPTLDEHSDLDNEFIIDQLKLYLKDASPQKRMAIFTLVTSIPTTLDALDKISTKKKGPDSEILKF
jgi:hypothetical protein